MKSLALVKTRYVPYRESGNGYVLALALGILIVIISSKSLILIFITTGGLIGGYIPILFGNDGFSPRTMLAGKAGSLIGIWGFEKMGL